MSPRSGQHSLHLGLPTSVPKAVFGPLEWQGWPWQVGCALGAAEHVSHSDHSEAGARPAHSSLEALSQPDRT